MSGASTYTRDYQWDAYEILGIQRDRRCVGWATTYGRKCQNRVNWKDMDRFYALVDGLSSYALDATSLQPRLRKLAAVGLCLQQHRDTQRDSIVDTWTEKITAATVRRNFEELEVESYYSRTDTRSSTASLHTPATRRTESSTSTNTVRTSSTVQDDIDSILRCLEAAREQERILVRRLASLQTPDTPRIQRAIQDRTEPPPSTSDTPSVVTSRSVRSQSSSTSHRSTSTSTLSTLSPSSSDLSSPPAQREPTRISSHSPSSASPTPPQHHRLSTQTSTRSTTPPPPPCPTPHVRRLPIAEECPICYEAMSREEALVWCKGGCGQSMHGECMGAWRASLVAEGRLVRCTMCRGEWDEGCEC